LARPVHYHKYIFLFVNTAMKGLDVSFYVDSRTLRLTHDFVFYCPKSFLKMVFEMMLTLYVRNVSVKIKRVKNVET